MSLITNIDKLKLINTEIKNEQTGNPKSFAKKLKISRSMLYVYIEDIKKLGAEITYNRKSKTFFYKNNFDIKIDVDFDKNKIHNL